MFNDSVPFWIDELCDFPYWFLCMKPRAAGSVFPLANTLALTTPLIGSWVCNGWLRTVPGQTLYTIHAPYEDKSTTSAGRYYEANVRKLDYVKHFTEKGEFLADLPVANSSETLRFVNFDTTQEPLMASLEQHEDISYISFSPTPKDYGLYAVKFSLSSAPLFQVGSAPEVYNRWMTYAPQAIKYKCLMHVAEFFHESTMRREYQEFLLGNPPDGEDRGGKAIQGELARLKRETRQKYQQDVRFMQHWDSARQAIGRGGRLDRSDDGFRWNRRPYR